MNKTANLSVATSGVMAVYTAMLTTYVGSLLIHIFMARTLTPEDFGGFRLIVSMLAIGALSYSLGLDALAIRFGAELVALKQSAALRRLMFYLMSIRTLFLLILVFLILYFWKEISSFFNFPVILQGAALPTAALFSLNALNLLWGRAFLAGRLEHVTDSIIISSENILKISVFVTLLYLNMSLTSILQAWGLILLASFIGYSVTNVRWLVRDRQAASERVNQLPFGTWRLARFAFFAAASNAIYALKDLAVSSFIIAHLLSATDVAIYGIAATLVVPLSQLSPASVGRNLITSLMVARIAGGPKEPEIKRFFHLTIKWTWALGTPAYISLAIFGDEVITLLFTEKYAASYIPLVVLSLTYVFFDLSKAFIPVLNALEQREVELGLIVVSAANIVMSLFLIDILGVNGAAVATGISQILTFVYFWIAVRTYCGIKLDFPIRDISKVFVIFLPVLIFFLLVDWAVSSVMLTLSLAAFGFLLYVMSAVIFLPGREVERRIVASVLNRAGIPYRIHRNTNL